MDRLERRFETVVVGMPTMAAALAELGDDVLDRRFALDAGMPAPSARS